MNLGELAHHQHRMAAAGWSADQVAAFAAWAVEWRDEQTALRKARRIDRQLVDAVRDALFADEVVPVSGQKGDELVPVSERMGRKHAAIKATSLAPGLAPQTKAVVLALIDRCNLETGRCDPSRATLAADAGITCIDAEKAVSRAVREAERSGLILRRGRGGRSRSNAYAVRWQRFRELLSEIEGPAYLRRIPAALGRINGDKTARRNGDNRDDPVPQTHIEIQPSAVVERPVAREPRQLELRVHQVVAGTEARQQALERVDAALRGKYRRAEDRQVMYAGMAQLDETSVTLVVNAERNDSTGLKTLEALLGRGPPLRASG